MKKNSYAFLIALVVLLMYNNSFAQVKTVVGTTENATSDWMPAKIQADGGNSLNGVEFYVKNEKCNSTDYLIAKLINTNSYAVNVTWVETEETKKTVRVEKHSEVTGDCAQVINGKGEKDAQLVVKRPDKDKQEAFHKKMLASLKVTEVN